MGDAGKVVAVLAANPALTSILSMVLASSPKLRVRHFESGKALATYMRLAPVDLVVGDFDCDEAPADSVARILRHDDQLIIRDFEMIALTRQVSERTRHASVSAGIDEVIIKPMSPRYLLERVLSRLRNHSPYRTISSAYRGPERRQRLPLGESSRPKTRYTDNVIPLFGDRFPTQLQ